MAGDESKKKNPLGETGETVAANVKRLREGQRLAFTQLAAKLDEIGRPIPTLGLRHIEANKRRVDADDLVALSVALEVSPITLLMPTTNADGSEVQRSDRFPITGHSGPVDARLIWSWLKAEQPLSPDLPWTKFISEAWPRWVQEQFSAEAREQLQKSLFNFGPGGDSHGDN